jgi:hypothetical protein
VVQIHPDPPIPDIWGLSSAGRASPLHGEGQRFDPVRLHHFTAQEVSDKRTPFITGFLRQLLFKKVIIEY